MPEPVGSWPAGTYPYSTISQPGSRQAGIETENQTCICTHHHTQRQQPAKEGAGAAYAHRGRPVELPCRDSWPHSCATGAHPQRQESAPKSRLRGSGAAHRQRCRGVPGAPPRDSRRRRGAPPAPAWPTQPPIQAGERLCTSVRESPILRAESRRSGPTPAAAPHAGKQRRAPQGRRWRAPRPSRGWRCRPRPRRRLCCPPLRTAR